MVTQPIINRNVELGIQNLHVSFGNSNNKIKHTKTVGHKNNDNLLVRYWCLQPRTGLYINFLTWLPSETTA